MSLPSGLRQIISTYGDPRGSRGKLSAGWYRDNIISAKLPYPMRLAWKPGTTITAAPVHRLAADDLVRVLETIWRYVRVQVKREVGFESRTSEEYDRLTMERIRELGLDLFGGTFNYREQRAGSKLSTHAWGIAIDLDPSHNAMGTAGTMPGWVVQAFEKQGWTWGGRFSRRDPMHFQRCSGY